MDGQRMSKMMWREGRVVSDSASEVRSASVQSDVCVRMKGLLSESVGGGMGHTITVLTWNGDDELGGCLKKMG